MLCPHQLYMGIFFFPKQFLSYSFYSKSVHTINTYWTTCCMSVAELSLCNSTWKSTVLICLGRCPQEKPLDVYYWLRFGENFPMTANTILLLCEKQKNSRSHFASILLSISVTETGDETHISYGMRTNQYLDPQWRYILIYFTLFRLCLSPHA